LIIGSSKNSSSFNYLNYAKNPILISQLKFLKKKHIKYPIKVYLDLFERIYGSFLQNSLTGNSIIKNEFL